MPRIDAKTYELAFARAVAYVRRRMAGQPWAESDLPQEIASEAMLASFDPKRYPWKGDKPLGQHVVNVARSLLSDRFRAYKLRAKEQNAAAADESMKRSALSADASVRARDRQTRQDARHEKVMEQLPPGTARDVYLLYLDDVLDVDEQVAILGKPKSVVYEARKRVIEVLRETPAEPESSPDLASAAGDDDDDDGDGVDDGWDDEAAS
jgi:hypothetical protein